LYNCFTGKLGLSNNESNSLDFVFKGLVGLAIAQTISLFPLTSFTLSNENIYIYKHVLLLLETIQPIALPRIFWVYVVSLTVVYFGAWFWTIDVHAIFVMITYEPTMSQWLTSIGDRR